MNSNGCLMVAILAIIAIFICYYFNSSNFADGQPQAAKWASAMGLMGYGDTANNIQEELYRDRMYGSTPSPVDGIPNVVVPKPSPHKPDDIDRRLKRLETVMEKEFHLNPKVWQSDNISRANDLNW